MSKPLERGARPDVEMQTRILDAAYAQQKRMEVASPQATRLEREMIMAPLPKGVEDTPEVRARLQAYVDAVQPAAGTTPTLNELLESARRHVMTDEEKEAQRQSWVRGEMALSESERGMTSPFPPKSEGTTPQAERLVWCCKGTDGHEDHCIYHSPFQLEARAVAPVETPDVPERLWCSYPDCPCEREHDGICQYRRAVRTLQGKYDRADKSPIILGWDDAYLILQMLKGGK